MLEKLLLCVVIFLMFCIVLVLLHVVQLILKKVKGVEDS
jgi:hypothetical protein